MSKMDRAVEAMRDDAKTGRVTNFMGGNSYVWNAMDTLKLVSASSIFGEPAYYRNGAFAEKTITDGLFTIDKTFVNYEIEAMDPYKGMKTSELMEKIIDEALSCDYAGVLAWAVSLRKDFFMRLNPQVIMVRAAMHEGRTAYTEANPGKFAEINEQVMQRADDVLSQITYYLFVNGGKKNNIPGILKKSWTKKISGLTRYELYKYRNAGMGLIDAIRICHAKGKDIDELMTTGTIAMAEEDKTWETLRASGMNWNDILNTIRMNHMALLRNLRGILSEVEDSAKIEKLTEDLKRGVLNGKQFPFRYMSAYNAIKPKEKRGWEWKSNQQADPQSDLAKEQNRETVRKSLEECMNISCANMPHLHGNNAFLSDNSGSAWGTFNSEYGSVTIANIDNLSSVIGAYNSDHGTVVKFGDKMIKFEITKEKGVLEQAKAIDADGDYDVGGCTENGVWLFFKEALEQKIHYDNIFIYSDMQAGHGELYGTYKEQEVYTALGYGLAGNERYIDVAKLIADYRKKVNPKVNVFCVQTAGYNNVLVPENAYRSAVLYGWTGKELLYADIVNKFWDEKDAEAGGPQA